MQPVHNTLTAVAVSLVLCCTPAYAEPPQARVSFDGNRFNTPSPDLFQGKAELSPGDAFTARISLANDSSKPQLFMLSLETPEVLSSEGQTLLEAAELTVRASDGYPYYEGPLAGERLRESIELEACEPGEMLDLDIRILVPAELGNGYAMSNDMLHWRFSALPLIDDETASARMRAVGVTAPGSAYDQTGYRLLSTFALLGGLLAVGVASFVAGSRKRR